MKTITVIRKRISNAHPEHHAIVQGMAWVALFVFIGKLAGAAKEMVIAYRYGVSPEVDAYLFIFNLINWPVTVWFSILTIVLVPLAARIRQNAPGELSHFRSELLAFALVLGLDLALIFWFGLPILLRSSWVGLSTPTVSIAIEMAPNMIALAPLGILVALFSAWMMSSERHANTLLEGVPALTILVALLILPTNGIEPLVWGTLAGFICHVASLATPLAWRGEIEMPRFTSHSPQWSPFWQGFGIMLVGQTLTSFIGIVDQFFAAHLDTGAIATISYANRIIALILGLGATTVSRATLPVFSRIKSQQGKELQRIAMFWVRLMMVLGVVILIISWWLAPWIIKLLFERGAFTPRNTEAVTEVFRYGLAQIPFYFPALALVSLLASHGKYNLIAISGSTNLLVKTTANYVLVPIMGANGIMLAMAFTLMVSLVQLYWFTILVLKQHDNTG
ncbi:MAG: murein biosynthesis integral membrane protein MurJ [Methylobacter sp.]